MFLVGPSDGVGVLHAESFCYRDDALAMLVFDRQRDAFYTRLRLLIHLLLLGSFYHLF